MLVSRNTSTGKVSNTPIFLQRITYKTRKRAIGRELPAIGNAWGDLKGQGMASMGQAKAHVILKKGKLETIKASFRGLPWVDLFRETGNKKAPEGAIKAAKAGV